MRSIFLLLALVACTRATGTPASDKGAVMTHEGVTMRRLGDVSPHMTYVGTSGRSYVDPSPIVMWGGARPAAALYLEIETRSRKADLRVASIDGGARIPGFPITSTFELPPGATSEDAIDGIDTSGTLTADLDGDGVQELVLTYRQGGVDVHSVRGPVARYPSPAARPGEAYRRSLAQVARLGSREVVYVLSVARSAEVDDRNLLLRADARSVTRISLKGLERSRILALGAMQRPSSQEVDELLVLVADGDRDTALARYRPDGTAIAPPRRMYVRTPAVQGFRFFPRTGRAVLKAASSVLVLAPDKPANWIDEIKVVGDPEPRDVSLLTVVDLDGDPKLVYRVRDQLWAVDHRGTCYSPSGGGRWTELPKPGPYLRIPVRADARLWIVWQSPEGSLFAVETREKGTRPMTHDEWRRAADRYLPAAEAEAFRKKLEPSLERPHPYRDMSIQEEREERHVGEVRSVEEWKRLLPRSYAEVMEYDAKGYDVEVASRFRQLREDPKQSRNVPDPAGLRAFLEDLEVPARTSLLVIDGAHVSAVDVPGSPPRELETQIGGPVEYRIHEGSITAVLTLEGADPAGKEKPGFYLVEGPLAARR